jgi:AAHS family 4-hydroxybenzoate transporter-like MFS transporter
MSVATERGSLNVGAMLDEGVCSGRQKLWVALAAVMVIFDGVDIQLLGIAIPSIMGEWGIERAAFQPVLAAGLVGMMVGALFGGVLGDRVGRKRALIGSVVAFGLLTAASAQAESLFQLGALRFLAGVGLGGALPNASALTSEYVSVRFRALSVTLTIVCVPLGGVLAGLAGAEILPASGWRTLFVVGGLTPVAVAIAVMFLLPESPRYLARHPHRWPELRRILHSLGRTVVPQTVFLQSEKPTRTRAPLRTLFAPMLRVSTLAVWVAFFSCLLAVYSGFNWLPSLLTGQGASVSTAGRALAAFNLGGVVVAICGALLITPFGSKRALLTMAAVAVVGGSVLVVMPLGSAEAAIVIVLIGLVGGAINGVQTILYGLAAHVYATDNRATGVGAASAVGRFGAIASVFVGAWAIDVGGSPAYFLVIVFAMATTLISLAILPRHIPALGRPARHA